MRRTRKNTIVPNAASTIHLAAMPTPRTTPSASREIIEALNERLCIWTKKRKYASRIRNTGKMSIIPMRDWTKNMPSKQASVAAAMANRRWAHMRLARRYIIGMHRLPKMHAAIRQPKVLKPRST